MAGKEEERCEAAGTVALHQQKDTLLISRGGWQQSLDAIHVWLLGKRRGALPTVRVKPHILLNHSSYQSVPKPKRFVQSTAYSLTSQPLPVLARQGTPRPYCNFGSPSNGSDPRCSSPRTHHLHPRGTTAHPSAVSGCLFPLEETSAGGDGLPDLCIQKDAIQLHWILFIGIRAIPFSHLPLIAGSFACVCVSIRML